MKEEIITKVQRKLFELQDPEYRDFHSKLIPSVEKDRIIGVRTPILRKYAKEFGKTDDAQMFMEVLPHQYYEENNLHAFLIERISDYQECLNQLERFLPYIDNWATCDIGVPAGLKKEPERILPEAERWMHSSHPYIVRYGIGILMRLFLDEKFRPEYLGMVAEIRSEEYYVNMMIAWYFATALAKQYRAALPYLEEKRLSVWVHNKTIQKAAESYRITREQKEYLKTLKIK